MASISSRIASAVAISVFAVGLAGCNGDAGPATTDTGGPCTPTQYADPWIAFEPGISSTKTLDVGRRTWMKGGTATTVRISGDKDAVQLKDEHFSDNNGCSTSSMDWVTITAVKPGVAVLENNGERYEITVR